MIRHDIMEIVSKVSETLLIALLLIMIFLEELIILYRFSLITRITVLYNVVICILVKRQ
jgi:hypothetical protein